MLRRRRLPSRGAANIAFREGTVNTFTVSTTGLPDAVITESGSLPAGVTFVNNQDGTATLSGTPAAGTAGAYSLTITASNGVSPDATQSFALTVEGPPSITSAASTTFTAGTASSFTVQTTGYPVATTTTADSLPAGVTLTDNGDGTAILASTAATPTGTYSITINAANGQSPDASQVFTLTVVAGPAITSADNTSFTAGTAGSFTVQTSGYPVATTSTSDTLPTGVTLIDHGDGTATLASTAATPAGVYTVHISASNGVSPDATQTFMLTVEAPPTIISADNASFTEGVNGSFTINTTGAPDATITETGSLPSGLTFTDNGDGTATISGTPGASTANSYTLQITASNGVSPAATQTLTLTVNAPNADLSVAVTDDSATPGSAVPGSSLTYTIVVTNSGPSDVTGATVADTLPAGFNGATFTATQMGGASGFTASGSGDINDAVDMPAGSTITYVIAGAIDAGATGTLSNTATVTAPGGVTDSNSSNDSATDSATLTPVADLLIAVTDDSATPGSAAPGSNLTYTVVVTNSGPSDVTSATVADALPANFNGAAFTATQTGGASGFTASGNGDINDAVDVPVGSTITYVISGTIDAGATGTLSNTATVTAPGGVTDSNSGNNSDTDSNSLS